MSAVFGPWCDWLSVVDKYLICQFVHRRRLAGEVCSCVISLRRGALSRWCLTGVSPLFTGAGSAWFQIKVQNDAKFQHEYCQPEVFHVPLLNVIFFEL